MYAAHDLLNAGSPEKINQLLGSMTIRHFLGDIWVKSHPNVDVSICEVERLLTEPSTDQSI
jgi:hypothetical protein